jgi:D-3-phosphoglycerate dehydrogenase
MTRPRILVSECAGFSARAAALLGGVGELVLGDLDRGALLRGVRDVDVLWVRLRHRIDAELLDAAPRLRLLATPTTGLTHVDTDEAARRGVRVLSLRDDTAALRDVRATAEHTIGLMLALLRKLPAAAAHVTQGGWDRDRFKGRELYGLTVGIVGYGRLGRIVGRYLRAFDVRVLATDPHVPATEVEPGVTLVPLATLLAGSDVVTLHASHSPATRNLLGAAELADMRRGALLVNTARGELVDEGALLDALRTGQLGGAALDVLADERPAGMGAHPLVAYARDRDDVVITPHIGGCTRESMEKTELHLARRLVELLATGDGAMPAAPAAAGAGER